MSRVDPVMLRQKMVEREVVGRGITDGRVVDAMLVVPRHLFVDEALASRAYLDQPLPIGAKQTISRPSIVALMTMQLQVEPSHRVLEIGTGSGYQAAVLARLAMHVDTIERHASLARRARRVIASLAIRNVTVHERDGSMGLGRGRRFPRIIVTCGAPDLLDVLFEQLEDGGRMVVPVAEGAEERLHVIRREGTRQIVEPSVACAFVPLVGEQGHAPVVPHSLDDLPILRGRSPRTSAARGSTPDRE